jgi:hypothetical protein
LNVNFLLYIQAPSIPKKKLVREQRTKYDELELKIDENIFIFPTQKFCSLKVERVRKRVFYSFLEYQQTFSFSSNNIINNNKKKISHQHSSESHHDFKISNDNFFSRLTGTKFNFVCSFTQK